MRRRMRGEIDGKMKRRPNNLEIHPLADLLR
jgi:hypothetical protein